jgi:hypothetical protein
MIFQKDYWKMSDSNLERMANKYKIPPWGRAGKEGEHWFVDREHIITTLLNRDTALRTNWAIMMSLVSLALSIAALLIKK